jgi:hypothetical protein
MVYRLLILGSLTLTLAACATPKAKVTELRAPDGTFIKNVKCNVDAQKCLIEASASCDASSGSYKVISSHSNAGGAYADIFIGPVTWFNMTYACGPSDGKMPDFAFKGQQYIPPPAAPSTTIINQQRPTLTNCTRVGNTMNCSSF